jgi:hypothetical protein
MPIETPNNKPQMHKDFSELAEKGIVTITTTYTKSKTYPEGRVTIEKWQLVFTRVPRGENSKIGTSDDITFDYLDDGTKSILINSVESGQEIGSLNIPGASKADGTRVTWMLKLIREPSSEE